MEKDELNYSIQQALRCEFDISHEERMVEIYKNNRIGKVADNTINNELNTLSGIFTKAIEWKVALFNPVHNIRRFRIKERKRINLKSNLQCI